MLRPFPKYFKCFFYAVSLLGLWACQTESTVPTTNNTIQNSEKIQLFQQIPTAQSKVTFENKIVENNRINILNYLYYYNGSGVAVGDINNDGLPDLYFAATVGKNKLFLNKGNLQFEDITLKAKVAGEYSITTGVNFIDINNDGFLDLYVCKSGADSDRYRTNQLFINNQDLTFTESAAAYGLADNSFSNQAYFFDFDQDEDLDMYLVNHPIDWPNINKIGTEEQEKLGFDYRFSDKLYRNNGNGKFEDITRTAGVLNRSWGLSASIGDFNADNLPDIYVANDFIKPDFLYINNGDGTFSDQIQSHFRHISFFSMGTDYADINNDGLNDLFVADMAMKGHTRSKKNMGSMSTETFQTIIKRGYHYPYSSNTLQLNTGKQSFVDIALTAGVAKTDWSWAPLLADLDNDGHKDIFVTNGIYRDIIDNDFLAKKVVYDQQQEKNYFDDLIQEIPQTKVKNQLFRNKGDLTFKNISEQWGIDHETNSNGAAYADLDLDGDLDLITNNLNEPSAIYENLSSDKLQNNYVTIQLTGSPKNLDAIGTKVELFYGSQIQRVDRTSARGYLSSVSPIIHFGIGQQQQIDSLKISWPDGKITLLVNPKINQLLVVNYKKSAFTNFVNPTSASPLFADITEKVGLKHTHQEQPYDDFAKELLLPHKLSQNGPFVTVGDVNGDGLSDFYIGGAANYSGMLYLQQSNQTFIKSNEAIWARDRKYEDQQALFFDADQDGDLDLYIVSGSNEFTDEKWYQDRLYLNNGQGNFTKTQNALPTITASGMAVAAGDFDGDNDIDLFIGGRQVPGKYPSPPQSYLLENRAGKFVDITQKNAPEIQHIGMVTDAIWSDYDNDQDLDLIVVGEWMPITIFENNVGHLTRNAQPETDNSTGWWMRIASADLDKDGDQDYIVGNIGTNNKYQPTADKPLHIYYNDFDGNGTGDIVLSKKDQDLLFPVRGRECSSQQMPFIAKKFPDFASFSTATMDKIYDREKLETALHYTANEFSSLVLINQGNGQFEKQPLPTMAQISPMMGIELLDLNEDGHLDLLTAGNFWETETETIRYDAGSGLVLQGDGQGNFEAISAAESGLLLKEDVRDLKILPLGNGQLGVLVASNNTDLELLVKN